MNKELQKFIDTANLHGIGLHIQIRRTLAKLGKGETIPSFFANKENAEYANHPQIVKLKEVAPELFKK